MKKVLNLTYLGADNRESLYDMYLPDEWNHKIVLFSHGYMGFKDWGAWNLVADFFSKQGFAFFKYNVSHNGCTLDSTAEFKDLEAFKNNSYSKEVYDMESMIRMINKLFKSKPEIHIIGHSRGGGIALLNSHNYDITSITTWAAIANIESRFPTNEALTDWKNAGVYYRENGRTKQKMPHSFGQYLNFQENKERLNIKHYVETSKHPIKVIHGDADDSVSITEGEMIAQWSSSELSIIKGANHTFGSKHPFEDKELPSALKEVCDITIKFISDIDKNRLTKLSILSELVKLAQVDNEVKDEEFQFLFSVANQLNVTKYDFKQIFDKYIDFHPPKKETDRIVQFQRLVMMMNVDNELNPKEIQFIRNAGIRMGLNPSATEEIIQQTKDNKSPVIPGDELMRVFNTFNN